MTLLFVSFQELSQGFVTLAFKGQIVANVYRQMTSANVTTLDLSEHWMEISYAFEERVSSVITGCFDNLNTYIEEDMTEVEFQDDQISDQEAAERLKSRLDIRYDWVRWIVLTYKSPNTEMHLPAGKGFIVEGDHRKIIALPLIKAPCDYVFPPEAREITSS